VLKFICKFLLLFPILATFSAQIVSFRHPDSPAAMGLVLYFPLLVISAPKYLNFISCSKGHPVAYLVEAATQKVVGWIPDDVTGLFN
jgi:hypothetical protein